MLSFFHSIIRDCEFVIVSFNRLNFFVKVQPATFHQQKDTLKQSKSSKTNPLKDSKTTKL